MTDDMNPSEPEERVAQLLRQAALTERAPQRLREELTSARVRDRARSEPRGWGSSARQALAAGTVAEPLPRRSDGAPSRRRLGSLVAAPLAVAALILAVSFAKSGTVTPSIAQAATLATLSPATAAPKPDVSSPRTLLTAEVQGLHFPNWATYGGWRATGARTDQISGRAVTTVFYARGHTQLAYSIVAQPALINTGRGSDEYEVFHKGARTYVVWTVSGHTCLVSGVHVSGAALWHLARTTTEA